MSFPRNKNCKSGYESTCKHCSLDKQNAWKETHQQQYKAAKRRWYERNTITVWAKAKEYARTHPEWKADHCAKRRRRNVDATPKWETEFTEFVAQEARLLCKARKEATGIEWHIDYVIPLKGKTVSGLHVWNNLAVIPASVNIKKGNRYGSSTICKSY